MNLLKLLIYITVFTTGITMASPSVKVSPDSITDLSQGDSFSIDIILEPNGAIISAGEIDLSFDNSLLEVTGLTKGDILGTDALDIGTTYDNTAGRVKTVLARVGVTTTSTQSGIWATINFKVKSDAHAGTTTISITDVGLSDDKFNDITDIKTIDGTATISGKEIASSPTSTFTVTPTITSTSSSISTSSHTSSPTPTSTITPTVTHTSTITVVHKPVVKVSPDSITGLTPNDKFSIDIILEPDEAGISAGEIDLSFDNSILEVTNLTKGDILGTDALDIGTTYDNTDGTIRTILARVGVTIPPTQSGTWATINFKVKSDARAGTTRISITKVGFSDEKFNEIGDIQKIDGTVMISGQIVSTPTVTQKIGDVNNDGSVSISDALYIAQYTVGLKELTSEQMSVADVNHDNKVNIIDALDISLYTIGLKEI